MLKWKNGITLRILFLLEIQFDLGGLKAWPSALMVQPFYTDKNALKFGNSVKNLVVDFGYWDQNSKFRIHKGW